MTTSPPDDHDQHDQDADPPSAGGQQPGLDADEPGSHPDPDPGAAAERGGRDS